MATRLALKRSGGSKRIVKAQHDTEPNDTFEMANLYPRHTGLPMTIWVSPRGRARHDAWIKLCLAPGDRMDASNTAVVAIRRRPRLISGELTARNFDLVASWITRNAEALIDYWNGTLSTVEFAQRMEKLAG
jgi:hypothetical protein